MPVQHARREHVRTLERPVELREHVVRALEGVVLDPFMGGGSTIAAAEHCGYASIGLEIDPAYFDVAVRAVPRLARYTPGS